MSSLPRLSHSPSKLKWREKDDQDFLLISGGMHSKWGQGVKY